MLQGGKRRAYSSARDERFDNSALVSRLLNLANSQSPLHNLQRCQVADRLLRQALARQLQDTSAGDTGQNQLAIQRSGDKLQATGVTVVPDDEEVASASLGDLAVLAEQPQNLIKAHGLRLTVGLQRRTVVGAKFGPTETTGPGTDGIRRRSEKLQALRGLGLTLLLNLGEIGPGDGNDEEQSLLRNLDTQVRAVTNDGRAEIQEGAGTLLGEPAYSVPC